MAVSTSLDPRLDSLLLRFHLETAARTSGAPNLLLGDLDPDRCLIVLREQNSSAREQPVSRTLMRALLDHADERGVPDPQSQLLRFPDGRPMTKIRDMRLWDRVRTHIKEVDRKSISTHWLRHTTLTWVERNFGPAGAMAYAGHAPPNLWRGVTVVYVTDPATGRSAWTSCGTSCWTPSS